MLKKIKKEDITLDEKEELISRYYSKSRNLTGSYDLEFYSRYKKDRMAHLNKLIEDLTDIKTRILELENKE